MSPEEVRLSTPRLELTALTARDLEVIWPSVSDPAISQHMSWNAHQSKNETLAFLKRIESDLADDRGVTWAIRSRGEFCGVFSIISILRAHRALRYDRCELAYWCGVKHRGKGLMTEAGLTVIEFAFTKLPLHRIVVSHHLENDASRRLIERLGFKLIGIEHEAFMKGGRWLDTKFYELLARDYRPVV